MDKTETGTMAENWTATGGDRSGAHRQSQEAAQGDNKSHKGSPDKGDNKPSYKGKPSTNARKSVGSVGGITSEIPALSLFPRLPR